MSSSANPQERLIGGTMLVMAAEALAFPAGLLATILLTRYMLPEDYGALALALAGIAWLEWTVVSLFSRASWKLVAEAGDWRSVAKPVVRIFLFTGLLVALLVFAGAGVAAELLGVPQLSNLLRVLAFEIPVFATAHAYRSVLVGRGMHGSRATVSASRWIARAVLIAAGTLLGLSLNAIAALIVGTTCVEFIVARSCAIGLRKPPGLAAPDHTAPKARITVRQLLAYATPLAASAICLRLLDRVDIFALRLFGGSMENVAAYGVAQNLSLGPGLFGAAFVPVLVAGFSYRASRDDRDGARRLSGEAFRAGFLVLAMTIVAAGAAPGLIELLFGARYAAAAPLFAILIVGAAGTLLIGLATAVLTGAGELRWTVKLTAPLLLVAATGHFVLVPRFGAMGAAIVTAGTALVGASVSCAATHVLVGTPIPFATLFRALFLGCVAAWGIGALDIRGATVLPVLIVAGLLLACGLVLLGELRAHERAQLRTWSRTLLRPAASAVP